MFAGVNDQPVRQVLSLFFDSFEALVPYDVISYAAIDGDYVRAVWRRCRTEIDEKIHPGFRLTLDETSLAELAESGRPRYIDDTREYLAANPQSVSTQLIVAEGIRSSLTCPLVVGRQTVGFLFFSSCDVATYRDLPAASLTGMASILAVVIGQELAQQEAESDRVRLAADAHSDALTGALNRRGMESMFAAIESANHRYGVIFVDVDNMKAINDTYGHQIGDVVLKQTVAAIRNQIRDGDVVARVGGDEFVVVLPGVTNRNRLDYICAAIVTECAKNRATVSVGAVFSDRPEVTVQDLVDEADKVMYEAKRMGGNRASVLVLEGSLDTE